MDTHSYTPLDEIPKIRDELREGFRQGRMRPISLRKTQLLQLAYMIKDNVEAFRKALASDLGRPILEADFLDINPSIGEIMYAYKNVEKWAKDEKPGFNILYLPMNPHIRKEPKGVVLIIAPFNYPMWLAVSPLAGAIAAGNAVVLKPSEYAPAVAALFGELFPKYLDSSVCRVVQGAAPEAAKLLELQWDHILYTGSSRVGRIVAQTAAKHLTPVTLELGGKSPVVLDAKMDMELAARRILWGKVANAGQTCVAPDYVLVTKEGQELFVDALKKQYKRFYPDGASNSDSLSRIVSPGHFRRVKTLLDKTRGNIVLGGETDEKTKFIAPTIVTDVKADDSLMSDELFAPVLAIVPVDSIDDAIKFINERDHPLAVYVFTYDAKIRSKVLDNTLSGTAVVNETVIQPATPGLPFGGVGPSGYGAHTGKYGFDTFTHARATLSNPKWVDILLNLRYPPYTSKKRDAVAKLQKANLPPRPGSRPPLSIQALKSVLIFVVGILVALNGPAVLNKVIRSLRY